MKTPVLFVCLALMLFIAAPIAVAQQVIGSFPQFDGGFESQTPFTSLSATTAIPAGTQSTSWTVGLTTNGIEQVVDNASLSRTGSRYARFGCTSTASAKRFHSPTTFDGGVVPNTTFTIQFFYRTKDSNPPSTLQVGVFQTGTVSGYNSPPTHAPVSPNNASPGAWQKTSATFTTIDSPFVSPQYGTLYLRFPASSLIDSMDIDDLAMYAGVLDTIPPDQPTSPSITGTTTSQISLQWNAPVTGVDGGGYIVVRKQGSSPSGVPLPNGIYKEGNTVGSGEVIAYVGQTPSFTDIGLVPSTHYYYRIYAVDKAFNYSSLFASIDGSTATPSLAAEPTVQATNVQFSAVTSSGMTISWTNGNGANHLVIVRAGSAVATDPVDGVTYVANPAFGTSGTELGSGFVVFNGTGSSVAISGLARAGRYYVAVYEFNTTAGSPGTENYLLTNPAVGNQLTLPGSVVSAQSGAWNATATWVGGVLPTSLDNVTIASGHTVTLNATQEMYNLTVQSGATLISGVALPVASTSIRYVSLNGSSVVTDGTLGGASDAIGIQCRSSVTLSGTGVLSPCRLRPAINASGISMIIDQNMTLTYSGTSGTGGTALYTDNNNNDNISITLNAGRTLTFADNANFFMTNDNSNGLANSVILLNGTTNMPGLNSSVSFKVDSSKSCTVNINGALNVGHNFTASASTHAGTTTLAVGAAGSVTVGGTADFTLPEQTITGAGSFTLASGGILNIGSVGGIAQTGATGNIQTATRSFSVGGNYHYVGVAPQITGTGLPATVNTLTVSDTAGVILSGNVTVIDSLHCSVGSLDLNGHTIILADTATLRENRGHTVMGTSGVIQTTRTLNAPVSTDDIAGLGIAIGSSANLGSTVITRGHAVQSGNGNSSIKRYYDIQPTNNSALNATLVFSYDSTEALGFAESLLALFKSTNGGTSWTNPGVAVRDTVNNSLTLTGVNSFSRWTAGDSTRSLVSGGGTVSVGVALASGWNLISNPVTNAVPGDSVRQLYPTSMNSYAFEFSGGYVQRYRLANGKGYWEKFPSAISNPITGTSRTRDTLAVVAGWNIVGTISATVDTSTIVSIPPGLRASNWFGYAAGYTPVTQIIPGKGYWVKATGVGKFVLATAGDRPTSKDGVEDPLAALNSLTITDNGPGSQTLYFGTDGQKKIDAMQYELPPLPPTGAFDARFITANGGTMAEELSGERQIAVQHAGNSLTVRWNILPGGATYILSDGNGGGSFREVRLSGEGEVELRGADITKLALRKAETTEIPHVFGLDNNYPNPFNPSTRIRFALPVESRVTLVVYNMIGQRVKTLVRSTLEAGYLNVEWDGTNDAAQRLASGVYFLRLEAMGANGASFTATTKLVMVK
jgi:hypothetical protein